MPEQEGAQDQQRGQQDQQESLEFGVAQVGPEVTLAQCQVVRGKVDARHQHEEDQDAFHQRRIVKADAGIVGGKAAQAQRGKGMADRIQPGESGCLE